MTMILDAWMSVIARDGWAGARIDRVATVAGTTPAAVAAAIPDRWTALRRYGEALDAAALADAGSDAGASVRERLFTIVMARFDAAQDQRAAVRELASAARRDPGLATFMAMALPVSVARMAEAAGVATGGWLGPLRVQALCALVLAVTRTWLDDTSEDLAATMKALDERLAQAERWARAMPHRAPDVTDAPEAPRSADGPPAG